MAAGEQKKDTHFIDETCSIKEILHVQGIRDLVDKFLLDLRVNGRKTVFEVDTGSPVSLISAADKKYHFPHLALNSTSTQLECRLPLHVADSKRHPLLGRDWLLQLNLDFNRVFKPITTGFQSFEQQTVTALKDLLAKYSSVFDGNVGKISGVQASFNLRADSKPVYIKARPVAFAVRDAVGEEIDKFVEAGIWEKVDQSDWATPIVPVCKAGGKVRLCGDYKITVNPSLLIDDHPLPTVEELFVSVAGGERFSKIDLSQAYLQLEVKEEDRALLTLSTHKGLFRPTRLMYGVASAPAIFQRLMEQILLGIPGVTVFIDDIRVTGPDDRSHLQRLDEVLKRLSAHGMRANREKCDFFSDKIEYCGYMIDQLGVRKLRKKIDAIQNMPVPKDKEQVRSFIGLVGYYGRFFPNLSTTVYPLNNLLKNDVPFCWNRECNKSFMLVKNEMQSDRSRISGWN
ncbi:uncharacterized protein K02A2.6-like [Topomyia yanbarensis]|uniref:uncharacterized protein K02A2.6-like n=1 Tax=Topomyia yanbarensis TaxID=2498891 RepID=UPI00273C5339|nr:uncharacterized protein K02A2.6-like [Topomyia yanbarensis]